MNILTLPTRKELQEGLALLRQQNVSVFDIKRHFSLMLKAVLSMVNDDCGTCVATHCMWIETVRVLKEFIAENELSIS